MSELDRRHFRLLLEIDRLGTISAAARRLHVSQSAASQQLQEAERRLGFPLTRRAGRTVELLPAAQRLVTGAEVGEQVLASAEADARWLASSTGPTCRIAVGVYDNLSWLGAVQAHLDGLDGTAPIEVVRVSDLYGFDLLADAAAHAVIAPVERPTAGGRVVELLDDQLVGVVAMNHALSDRSELEPADFNGARYVTFSTTPEDGFEYSSFLGPAGVIPTDIVRVETISGILELVAATDRVTILCRQAVSNRHDVRCVPLKPAPPTMTWTMTVTEVGLVESVERTLGVLAERWHTLDQAN